MHIRVRLLNEFATLPYRAQHTDAGADLFATEAGSLAPGQRAVVKTGISLAIPEGYYGRIAPRSGLAAKFGVDVLAGVIDSSYRGEVGVVLINLGNQDYVYAVGTKIAQLIVEPCQLASFYVVPELDVTDRNNGGFGSTGA